MKDLAFSEEEIALSIVVPFYNETAFIETAVSSILSQNIDNIEIIIVNDNPGRFKQSYFDGLGFPDFVRVEHHAKNRGLPSSRNTGIRAARGAYIGFLDADDYYLPGGLHAQLKTAQTSSADVTHGQAAITYINKKSGHVLHTDSVFLGEDARGVYEGEDIIKAGFMIESSWSSIYRAAFLAEKGVKFDEEQVKFEDRIFVVDMLLAADRLAIMGKPIRAWRKRQNSITTSSKSKAERDLKINLLRKCLARWESVPRPDARYWMMREFTRQVCFMINKNETSPWYSAFGFSDDAESNAVTETLTELFASLKVTEADVMIGFTAQDPRYDKVATKNGKITPKDLYEFINAVANRNYETAREIVLRCLERPEAVELSAVVAPKINDPVEIILHFGLHKTGTTHIQQQLDANRAYLISEGILFLETGLGFGPNRTSVKKNGLPGHQRLVNAIFKENKTVLDELKAEIANSGCKTVIISIENLSQPQSQKRQRARRIREVYNVLCQIGNVRSVAIYRRPDSWLQSFYGELVSNGNDIGYQTPAEFLENNAIYLHFGDIVKGIEEATGQPCNILEFERALTEHDDLIHAFLDLCGLAYDKDALVTRNGTKYPASCNAQVNVARMLGLIVTDKTSRQNLLRTFFNLTKPTSQRGPIFTRAERERIIDIFCDNTADVFQARNLDDPRERWKTAAVEKAEPYEVDIPADYIEAICQAGIYSGAIGADAPVASSIKTKYKRLGDMAEVSIHDLNRMRSDLEEHINELDYMRNSISWKVSAPLRVARRGWERLSGR